MRDYFWAVVAARGDARIICQTENPDVLPGDKIFAKGVRDFIGYEAVMAPHMVLEGSGEAEILGQIMGGKLPEIQSATRVVWTLGEEDEGNGVDE